ncbi:MAG: hypothetical protein NZM25_08100 [Leptospiraceae bacterium]|nr:hypothetical protein [Leptospiraceae bacterium]MDW8307653.1 hypothetical protein [Leptospiraceae bacterium]
MKKLALLHQKINYTKRPVKFVIYAGISLRDIIVSLPFVAALKQNLPHSLIYLILPKNLGWMVSLVREIDGALYLEPNEEVSLLDSMRLYSFHVSVQFVPNLKLGFYFWLLRIPFRVGCGRTFSERLFFNICPRKPREKKEYEWRLSFLNIFGLARNYVYPQVLVFSPKVARPFFLFCSESMANGPSGLSLPQWLELAKRLKTSRPKLFLFVTTPPPHWENLPHGIEFRYVSSWQAACEIISQAAMLFANINEAAYLASLYQIPHVVAFQAQEGENLDRWFTLPLKEAPHQELYFIKVNFFNGCGEHDLEKLLLAYRSWLLARRDARRKQRKKTKEFMKSISPWLTWFNFKEGLHES